MIYNPYRSALSAAFSELSSPTARRYYSLRAQQDLQTALVLSIQFACFAYALGAQFRAWAEGLEQSAQSRFEVGGALVLAQPAAVIVPMIPVKVVAIASVKPLAITGYQPIALLNPAPKVKKPRKPAPPKPPKAPKAKTKPTKVDVLMGERDRWMPAPRKAPTTVRSSAGALIPID
jgi:hypothetical protein